MKKRMRSVVSLATALFLICSLFSFNTAVTYAGSADNAIPVKTMLFSTNTTPKYKSYVIEPGKTKNLTISPEHTGRMYIDVKYDAEDNDSADVYVLKNGNYTEFEDAGVMAVSKGKVYKIRVKADKQNQNRINVSLRGRVYTTVNRTLTQGTSKWTLVSGVNKSGKYATTYFKVKPDRTGLMTVALKEYGYKNSSGYVTLCDSKKKAISVNTYYNPQKGKYVYYGVKKGKTYYLKVTQCKGTKKQYHVYGIQYKMSSATDRGLSKKSSAKKLIRKDDPTKTLFTATGSKSTDWYKFYVSKTRKTQVQIVTTEITSGNVTVSIYKDGSMYGSPYTMKAKDGGIICQINNCTTPEKALPGWYYIKLEKSKNASGRYTICYKQ